MSILPAVLLVTSVRPGRRPRGIEGRAYQPAAPRPEPVCFGSAAGATLSRAWRAELVRLYNQCLRFS
jgi:hypothetical protein